VRSHRLVTGFGILVALDLLVLLATGVHLAFRYRPEPGASGTTLLEVSRTLHAITAWGALVLVVIAVVLAAVWLPAARRRVTLWLGGLLAIGSAGYGIVTGARLAWDQLALWAVTTGNSVPLGVVGLPDTVKFLIVGQDEVSPGTYSGRVWVHVLVVPAVFAIGIVLVLWSVRGTSAARGRGPFGLGRRRVVGSDARGVRGIRAPRCRGGADHRGVERAGCVGRRLAPLGLGILAQLAGGGQGAVRGQGAASSNWADRRSSTSSAP
jgi:hypothetical protein